MGGIWKRGWRRVFSQVWATRGEGRDESEKSGVGQKAAPDPPLLLRPALPLNPAAPSKNVPGH